MGWSLLNQDDRGESRGQVNGYHISNGPLHGDAVMARLIPAATTFGRALLIVAQLSALSFALAQEPSIPGTTSVADVTAEQLAESIRAIGAREDIDDATRSLVIEQLRDAEAQLQKRISAEAATADYAASLDTAPEETQRLQAILDEAPVLLTADNLDIDDTAELAELEAILANSSSQLAATEARLSDLASQIALQETRPGIARNRIVELRETRVQLTEAIAAAPPSGELPALSDARLLATQLLLSAETAELAMLEQEILSHTVRLNLLKVQRDVAARARADLSRRVELIFARTSAARQASALLAQQSAAAAQLATVGKHPILRDLAAGNAALTDELPQIAVDIERITRELSGVVDKAKDIEQRSALSRERLDIGGVSRVVGRLLIAESRSLPQVSQYRSDVRERHDTLANIRLEQIRIQEQRREVTPPDAKIEELMALAAEGITDAEELAAIRPEIRRLLRDRRKLLDKVENNLRSYLGVLGDLDIAERQLLDVSAAYKEFLNQHLLWIPSAPLVGTGTWQGVGTTVAGVLAPASWAAVLADLKASLRENAASAIVLGILILALVIMRRPLGARYTVLNSKVGRLSTDHIGLTLGAIVIIALQASPLPLLLALVGWMLTRGDPQSELSLAVGVGLLAVAPFLYNALLVRIFAAKDGVAHLHFGWKEGNLEIIRRQMNRLIAVGTPLAITTAVLFDYSIASDRATLGRLAFVALMVTFSLIIKPLAHPETGIAASHYERKPSNWVSRGKWVWYVLAAGGPLLLSLTALIGYVYAAGVLTTLLVDTIWLVFGMIVASMIVLRWLVLTRRKIAWQIALKKREAKKSADDDESRQPGELPTIESEPLNLDEVDQQTRKLLQAGLLLVGVLVGWGIWAEVLPAFSLLDDVALWSQTAVVDGVETVAPVTLADLMLALLVAAVTVISSRNLPGLMEIAILQRLTLPPGSRYAIITLVKYCVVIIGVIVGFDIVGWKWSQIQWLVAALSVGLGFGLQEIVANFVSGLVILFERPVRVGDTVTVGQLSGVVSQIRIRATTITDWDRKEIIVPNKSFITEQVVNWTLSDPIIRIVIPVGIAYGSDVVVARTVMEDTLHELPLVLDEPPPSVYFVKFGDSSLDFRLNVYLRQLDERFPLTHAVHEAILEALRKNNIEIPFPQHDLHLRSTIEGSNDNLG